MPTYLLHIGPHKTATTYLQLKFAAAREHLRERGMIFPAEWCASVWNPSHVGLVEGLRTRQYEALRSVFEGFGDAELVLLSAEDLSHLEQAEVEALAELINGHPTTVIFYCRRWSELLPSIWQERVKHGHYDTLAEYYSANINDPYTSPVVNFSLVLRRYAQVFGQKNIKIVSYSNLDDAGIEIAEHFFTTFMAMQIDILERLPPLANARPNRSLPLVESEIIRVLNALHAARGMPRGTELREWYLRDGRKLGTASLIEAITAHTQTVIFSDAVPDLQRLHDDLTASFGDMVVSPLAKAGLFSPSERAVAIVQPDYLDQVHAREELNRIYLAFLSALKGMATR